MAQDNSPVTRGLKTDLLTDPTGRRLVQLSIGGESVHLSLPAAKKLGEVMMAWGTMAERASLGECQACKGTGLRVGDPISPGGRAVSIPCLCLRGEVWRLIRQTDTPEELLGFLRWLQLR